MRHKKTDRRRGPHGERSGIDGYRVQGNTVVTNQLCFEYQPQEVYETQYFNFRLGAGVIKPIEPDTWDCRYFWTLRENYNNGKMTDSEVEPYSKIWMGSQIVAFIKAPIKPGEDRNIHELEKFNLKK